MEFNSKYAYSLTKLPKSPGHHCLCYPFPSHSSQILKTQRKTGIGFDILIIAFLVIPGDLVPVTCYSVSLPQSTGSSLEWLSQKAEFLDFSSVHPTPFSLEMYAQHWLDLTQAVLQMWQLSALLTRNSTLLQGILVHVSQWLVTGEIVPVILGYGVPNPCLPTLHL